MMVVGFKLVESMMGNHVQNNQDKQQNHIAETQMIVLQWVRLKEIKELLKNAEKIQIQIDQVKQKW